MVTAALLAFIALLQTYGQARADRYRKLADAAINSIGSEVNSIGSEVNSIGSEVGRLAAYLAGEEEEENGS